jgi:benzoyl-CoA reductase/2-hydroxyglutaryl-CoA dehydratase subunit BcrC/BadD/HgdB
MIGNCLEYARKAHSDGKPIVGIMCEYTPRELIIAAGAVPVCLCGGSAATIPVAEHELPANLCPLIKSTYGYHAQRSNPFLEMCDLIVAETTCDGKKKMYELMSETRPMYVLELPQKPRDPDSMAHWRAELVKFKSFMESRYNVEITPCRLKKAVAQMNLERRLRRDLAALMRRDAPPLTGRQLLDLKSSISCIPSDLEQYERALAMFDPHAGSRNGSVRVLMTGVPLVHGAERVLNIVEGAGGLVVAMENCTGIKPIAEDVDETSDDIMGALADKYFGIPCSVMTRNDRRMERIKALAGEYRAQCVIELVWQACLTYDVESARVKKMAEQELGLPYLRIETDYGDSDTASIAVRVEALLEMVKNGRRGD